jgi:HK97 gp10 family phage protein
VAKEVFKIEGLKELDAALVGLAEEFSPRNAKNVLRGALKDGAQIIADAGESLAPRLTGGLAQSYTVGTKLSRRQRRQHKKESAIEVFAGPGPAAKGVQTEFGNAHQAPEPHLRPAWDGNWRTALNLIIERAKERLEKTRRRLVKKAEREAAKLKQ